MAINNPYAAWAAFIGGIISGAIEGLFFCCDDWRGGYFFWRRRLPGLAHLYGLGIGLLGLACVLSMRFGGSSDSASPDLMNTELNNFPDCHSVAESVL